MTDQGWMPCSDRSRERHDPITGTAGFGERWFLVEIDGAWGSHAILQSRLPPEIAAGLVRRIEGAGMRPLAIRRTGRRTDSRREQHHWRWAVVDTRPGHESVSWGVSDVAEDLLEVPLDGSAGVPSPEPVICVCTHARHDQCCAVRGRPVVTALAKAYPAQTWECSHLGGDRFAATMIVFPQGLYFGRVAPATAPAVVRASLDGIADERYFRGRSSLPNAVQAAVAFASEAFGDHRTDAFGLVSHEQHGEEWTVALEREGAGVTVTLAQQMSSPLLSTCAATKPAPVREFRLESIEPDPARG